MEFSTEIPTSERSTGSTTIADLMAIAVERYGDAPAIRRKQDGEWQDISYRELGATVSEIGLGLIDLGIEPGDRVSLLCTTRPEWTYADFAITSAGATVVPIYPTNSPEECEWVVGNSESVAVVCEDASQIAKIVEVRDRLPLLRHLIVIDPSEGDASAISLAELRERGAARDPEELRERSQAVTADDPYTFIYTSGTTGPPKGCILNHGNYRSVLNMCHATGLISGGEVTYLFLPLAHAFALLIQLVALDVGGTLAYWSGDATQIVPDLMAVKPDYFPSVPRIFEKIYTLATSTLANATEEEQRQFEAAIDIGVKVRDMIAAGQEVPAELQAHFDAADERLYKNVRAIFGGNLRQAVTGAAPIAPRILEFFYACGVPVLEGYGMTETSTISTYSSPEHHRFGSVGRALPGCEVSIAEDGEILIRGSHIFQGYYKNDDASFGAIIDGWLHTGDVGRLDEDGFLFITGRKKDIIITAGGKNLTPANLENDMKQCRWVSQAVMHGDRRPYPVMLITLDAEEVVPWARERGLGENIAELAESEEVRKLIGDVLDAANSKYAQVEQVKKFVILPHDLAQETGELTPTMKVKRNVVNEKYATLFDALYED